MQFPDSWFEDEVRNGFYIPALMKRAWAAQLEVLEEVAKVCEKHHIRWFANYGTMLGAVRHGGFIPWDDDLDIFMLREDYDRFNAIAPHELPKGYYIPQNAPDEYRYLTRVCNGTNIRVDMEYLEKYHGFPYVSGIDIFVMDYIALDPEDENIRKGLAKIIDNASWIINDDNQDTEEMEEVISHIEKLLHVTLDRKNSIKNQLYSLQEKLFSLYTSPKAKEVVFMYSWVFNDPFKYPIEYFRKRVLLPFETTKIPVPAGYDGFLKIKYGDYMKICRTGSGHNYPQYQVQEDQLAEAIGKENLPFTYRFSLNDLKKPNRRGRGRRTAKIAQDCLDLMESIHKQILDAVKTKEYDTARELLGTAQEYAIYTGTILEETNEKGHSAAVSILEKYCDQIYLLYESLGTEPLTPSIDAGHIGKQLNTLLSDTKDCFKHNLKLRKEVVFLPWKASMWSSLEPIWREAVSDPNFDVYVIPIPYYYRKLDGSFKEECYEGGQFPDYVPITDYNAYDFENQQPDMVFIQNPYDDCNITTSVHPPYYSKNLTQYTDRLVYIPYFTLDETDPIDPKTIKNMKHYVSVPGVIHADKVIVQSGLIRKAYIDFLTTFAGDGTRAIWDEKIVDTNYNIFSPEHPGDAHDM